MAFSGGLEFDFSTLVGLRLLLFLSLVNNDLPDAEAAAKVVRLHLGWLERLGPGLYRNG